MSGSADGGGGPSREVRLESSDERTRGLGCGIRRHLFAIVLGLVLLVGGVAAASAAAGQLSSLSPLRVFREAKPRISNSTSWRPIIRAYRLVPGQVARGQTRIRNRGAVPGVLYLSMRNLRDTPPDQPRLSDRLWLRIWWKRTNGTTRLVWQGPMNRFHRVRVCVLKPRQARVFRFSVLFRGRSVGGWGDSSVMGHATRFGLRWRIVPRR